MTNLFRLRYEISFLFIALMMGILAFSSARELPEPTFEPMGSAAFPSAIATVTVLLVLLKSLQLFVTPQAREEKENEKEKEKEKDSSRFTRSLVMLSLLVAFVAMTHFLNLAWWISTSLFLMAAMSFLKKPAGVTPLIIRCLVIVAFSLILDYIATQVLYLDL
ncbi:tripartite tricarboxylate transporter TctB family protein [Halomonas cupida]|uniref:Tripartite tricarboxylate transporter TctB family protein n=1 Tax=Halomonas cupida TaxID=44933 RepID=A0A1M7CPT4_9GAMM|nr:tripartite tricarboxylate transporter TctB family protein [Halomonas cupida]SHL69245.1 Tripartite tricarboxylate transporter TctB family protein [Halomonas cupida]